MPVKNDDKRRWVELEYLVPGTPEQVWTAVATGPGMASWFTPAKVEEHVGGAITFDFGGGAVSSGKVTEWKPPERFGYEEYGWSGDAPPLATEVVVTARSGGKCVVRIVHSLFTTDTQWDDQFEGFEGGWPGFIEILRVYLADFAGSKAASVRVSAVYQGPESEAWTMLTEALGLSGANVDERRSAPDAALAGMVERVHQDRNGREMMVRLEQPAAGVAIAGTYRWENQTRAAISLYFYGEDAAGTAARHEARWVDWMKRLFPE